MLPITHLLPLRAMTVTLRFTTDSQFRPLHQPIVTAWLRHLLTNADYSQYLTIDTLENGQTDYKNGDLYRFTVFAVNGGEPLLQRLIERLQNPHQHLQHLDPILPLRDNVTLARLTDLWHQHDINHWQDLFSYTDYWLQQEIHFWQRQTDCRLRWLAPVALLKKQSKQRKKSRPQRFCQQQHELDFDLLRDRLHDAFANLLRQRNIDTPPRNYPTEQTAFEAHFFWLDYSYGPENKPMGGLLGEIVFECADWTAEHWTLWIIGQYLGIGRWRTFGWGRYQLETLDGDSTTLPRDLPAQSLLQRTCTAANVQAACAHFADQIDSTTPSKVQQAAQDLAAQHYTVPPLHPAVQQKRDSNERVLLIAPLPDRILQQAAAQLITPAITHLMAENRMRFRREPSRQWVADRIQQAYQDGYRWAFASEIHGFFDSLSWELIDQRLRGLFGDDPLLAWLMQWISAPVYAKGEMIERESGLLPASPLTPVLIEVMLAAFDRALAAANVCAVCLGNAFVVLSRTEAEAHAAVETVQQALTALELQLDPDQTTVRSFAHGFRFVEYVFINNAVSDTASPAEKATPLPLSIVSTEADAPIADAPLPALDDNAAMTVFVTGQINCMVRTEHGRLQVTRALANGLVETVVDQPWARVQTLVLFGGQHHITTPALRAALANAVVVHFVSSRGDYQGSTQAAANGMATAGLWLAQLTWFAERAHQLAAAQLLVQTRLRHQREVLRKRNSKRQFDEALAQLQSLLKQVPIAEELATLRGLEGKGAQVYFAALRTVLPAWVGFETRQRRPPPDPFNALLSLGYTVLFSYVEVALRVNGLLPWVGVYHQPHGQHAVLASDMMEPFRHLVERVALNAVRQGDLSATDFELDAERGCRLLDEPRRRYLGVLVQQFESPMRSLQSSEPRVLLQQLDWQAKQLRAWLRGEVAELAVWQVA